MAFSVGTAEKSPFHPVVAWAGLVGHQETDEAVALVPPSRRCLVQQFRQSVGVCWQDQMHKLVHDDVFQVFHQHTSKCHVQLDHAGMPARDIP